MRILLVEDDENLCYTLQYQLEQEGFLVDTCMDGEDALFFIRERVHDLILLDRMLPSMDGISVLKALRREKIFTPVIFLTALSSLQDKITGLDCGADDYMVKPFAFEELMARIRCLSRRPQKWEGSSVISLGDISFDPDQKKLFCHTKECSLSKKEGALMEIFLRNPGQILPRQTLLSRVWGPDSEVEDGNLDNYIYFLRRRLRSVDSRLELKAVRGVGYQLEVYRCKDFCLGIQIK
ncbi:response regulator transcription factor [Blautia hydrogenotrophica]|nr:response regulator transcription factor [Blautia hydrogenotrophica]MEE0463508.1 response regulator transcription factor [Blautia hydrogenotrophica]